MVDWYVKYARFLPTIRVIKNLVVLPGIEPGSGASETLILSIVQQDLYFGEGCLNGLMLLNLKLVQSSYTPFNHLKPPTITFQNFEYCCQIFLLQLRAILRQKTFL